MRLALLGLLALCACSRAPPAIPDPPVSQVYAQCELDGDKAYGSAPTDHHRELVDDYAATCMKAKGYTLTADTKRCPGGPQFDGSAGCYAKNP